MKYFLIFSFLFTTLEITSQTSDFKNISFNKADNIAQLFYGEDLYNLPLLTYNLTAKLETDVEKFRAIYTWVCKNIKGDYYMYKRITRNRNKLKKDSISYVSWNKAYSKKVYKKLLKHKKTMCTGYAYLIKTMAEIANIECKIIDGYSRNTSTNIEKLSSPNHSWNAIKLNNKWYLADATLSSGYTDLSINTFIFDYNDGYFLADPKLFVQQNYPLDNKWTLLNTQQFSITNYLSAPLIYTAAFKHNLYPNSSLKMNSETLINKTIHFKYQFLEKLALDKIELKINEEYFAIKKAITSVLKGTNTVNISFNFDKKGIYDVHLYYKNEIIASQTIRVKTN